MYVLGSTHAHTTNTPPLTPHTPHTATSPLDVAADEDPVMKSTNRKGSQVNFDIQVLDKRSKLSRDPTPFPKELHNRAMQWRAARDIHPEAEVCVLCVCVRTLRNYNIMYEPSLSLEAHSS